MEPNEIVYYVGANGEMYGQPVRIVGQDKTIPSLTVIEPLNVALDYTWAVAKTQLSRVNPIVVGEVQ